MNAGAHLDQVFSALSDPTRRAMLARLAKGDATVSELAAPFDMAQPTISKHLRVLEDAGLIRAGRDAQRRPRSLVVGGPMRELDAWIAPFRAQWEGRFDRLESFLGARSGASASSPRSASSPAATTPPPTPPTTSLARAARSTAAQKPKPGRAAPSRTTTKTSNPNTERK